MSDLKISQIDIDAITNSVKLIVHAQLADHKAEMVAASKETRDATVEALTGNSWEKRYRVRSGIEWAIRQDETQTRRRITLFTIGSGAGVTAFWEKISSFFNGS